MPDALEIIPSEQPIQATVRPPGSKSITNRALVCAALAKGASRLEGALDSEDTQVMLASLGQLGIDIQANDDHTVFEVAGCGGRVPVHQAECQVANSGTTMRFLTALLTLAEGEFVLDGIARMRQRPIGDLLNALQQLGAQVSSISGNDCPPVHVVASGLPGGKASIRGDISSQFLSGLLMACPYAQRPSVVQVEGDLVSKPYVAMTLDVMRAFGVDIRGADLQQFEFPGRQHYIGCSYAIEPDASAASYFWAAAAITAGEVTVEGLDRTSLQGDVAFCDCLEQMGCEVRYEPGCTTVVGRPLQGIQVDMNAISDTVQTLAAVALFAEGPTEITGVEHIRHKETDRIGDLATELRKLGAQVDERRDGLRITPGPITPASIATYNDHRMAMSLALVGLRQPGIVIENPACTEKTYPKYFDDLGRLVKLPL